MSPSMSSPECQRWARPAEFGVHSEDTLRGAPQSERTRCPPARPSGFRTGTAPAAGPTRGRLAPGRGEAPLRDTPVLR